jgi:starvation-inducible DNA-binding protein
MSVVKSTIPDSALHVTGDALQNTLVELLGLSLIGKQAHWNIVGPRFRSIHLQLDELVSAARSFADTVAERSAALGLPPDGPKDGWVRDTDVVQVMVDALDSAIARLRERIEATEKPDPVTQDLLITITAELEKQRWMFAAEQT